MANTTNQGWAKPTIGGSEDTWGQTVNDAIDAIDTLVGSVTAAEVAKLDGLTASTAELNKLDGVTATATEINRVDGVTSNIQTQLNAKAALAGSSGQAFSASTLDLGNWTVTQSGSDLKFAYNGTNRMKLDASGNLTVEGNVTARMSLVARVPSAFPSITEMVHMLRQTTHPFRLAAPSACLTSTVPQISLLLALLQTLRTQTSVH
jgi:hypothetical protein